LTVTKADIGRSVLIVEDSKHFHAQP